ncbi:MAG: hypothetical protein ACXWB2_19090 [Acidimicrobiales bacterium]
MTRPAVRYSCRLGALVYAGLSVGFAAMAVGVAVGLARGRSDVDPLGLVMTVPVALGLGFFSWWWVGCEVTVEGGYVAWRSLTRRRWIRLDRLTYVTAPGYFGTTMTLDTDDGGRLHVLVIGDYRTQARSFAASFQGPAVRPRRRGPARQLPLSQDDPYP